MKTVAILLVLPVLALAGIEIEIIASDDETEVRLTISGSNEDIISDQEIQTFQLTDKSLKAAVEAHFGGKPDDVFLRSPTPSGDLYTNNKWQQVSRILKPTKPLIISQDLHPYLVDSKVFENNSTKPFWVKTKLCQNLEATASSTWERSGEVSVTQDTKYNFNIRAMAVSVNTYSFNSRWGENFTKPQQVNVGLETEFEMLLQPKESVIVELYANKGLLKVQLEYVASLSGSVWAVNYGKEYNHFWTMEINDVLDVGALNKTVHVSKEFIDVGFYINPYVVDHDTDTE